MTTIASDYVDASRVGFIANASDELLGTYRMSPGDVLFSHINSEPQIGRAVVYIGVPPVLIHGMNLLRLRFKTDVAHPEFMAYLFRNYRERGIFVGLASRAVGQSSINQGRLKSLRVDLPPLSEQRAIARVLETAHKSKEARQRELVLERERKAALMEHLFTHGTRGERTKQTDIGDIPDEWDVSALADVAVISSGGTPDRTKAEYWDGAIPWVKTGEIRYNTILATEERITQEGLDNSSAKVYPSGTLLMAMYGQGVTRGKVAILGIDASINQACAAITSRDGRLLPRFAFYYLQFTYERIRILGHGANQKNLNSHLVGSIQVPIPPTEEQLEIATAFSAMDAKLDAIERESGILEELFGVMLQQLVSGGVSVSNLVAVENG